MGEYADSVRTMDTLLFARRLVQFCPTSFSLDDLSNEMKSIDMHNQKVIKEKEHFIPPEPIVSSISNFKNNISNSLNNHKNYASSSLSSNDSKNNNKCGRFAFLMSDIKKEEEEKKKKDTFYKKMKYELPNLKRVQPLTKSQKPIMVVSLSISDFSEHVSDNYTRNNSCLQRHNDHTNKYDNNDVNKIFSGFKNNQNAIAHSKLSFSSNLNKLNEKENNSKFVFDENKEIGRSLFPEARNVDSPAPSSASSSDSE